MFRINYYIISFLIILLLKKTVRPWEFPPVEDNVVIKTEVQIRSIINNIIQMFDIDTECAELLEKYFTIHNNLLATSLQDADKWKEVVIAAKVNVSGDMIDIVSDVVNEYTNYRDVTNIPIHKDEMIKLIDEFLQEVELSNVMYGDDIAVQAFIQNGLILKNSSSDEAYPDIPEQSYENETDFNEFWSPQNVLEESGRRIFSSVSTTVSRFPFMAAVIVFGQFHCAGTIIAKDLVITAASGVQLAYNNNMIRENPGFLAVRIGSTFNNVGGNLIAVLQAYFHPNYNPKNLNNNICVLRLVRHIRFQSKHKDKRVKKLDFDRSDSPLPNTAEILMLGWGATSAGNKMPKDGALRYARLNIYTSQDCKDIFSKEYVTIYNFCAGFVNIGAGACNQDVGDPGILNGTLYGIVSFGAPQCGAPDSPTVFTKISFYSDWIEAIMKEKVPTKLQKRTTTAKVVIYEEDNQMVTPSNGFPDNDIHSQVDKTNTFVEPTESHKDTTTVLIPGQETSTYYLGYTASAVDTEKVAKKKHGHEKKTSTELYDDYHSHHSPFIEYTNTVIKQTSKKHKKVTNNQKKDMTPSHLKEQDGNDEFQFILDTKNSHQHKSSGDDTEWMSPKKNNHKQLILSIEKTTTISPIRNSFTGKLVHNTAKNRIENSKPMIKSSLRTDIKNMKNKHHIKSIYVEKTHEKLLNNLHENTNLKNVGYNKKKVQIKPGISDDYKNKPTKKSKFMNSYLEPNYFEPNDDDDYVPSFDGQIQNILATPKQTRMKIKSNKKEQSNEPPNPKEEKRYVDDYEEHGESYEKGGLNEYGSPETYLAPEHEKDNEYNSEEYYNNDYEQSDHKSHISDKVSSIDTAKNDEISLSKDLKNLGSHELKQMFLEQLAKQSGDLSKMAKQSGDLSKISIYRDHSSNKESFPERSFQTPTTDTIAEVTQETDIGIYNFLKSAFDQIQLKFRRKAEAIKHTGKKHENKKAGTNNK